MTLLSVAEAAALVKLSPDTIRRMAANGEVEAYRRAGRGHYRIELNSLMAALHRVVPTTTEPPTNLKALGKHLLAEIRSRKQATVH